METSLEVKVPEFKKIFEGDKDVVYYTISLSSGRKTWTLNKRFSELEKLNADLKLNHGGLPAFPTKTLFSLKKYEDIDDRRAKIEEYLKVALEDALSASRFVQKQPISLLSRSERAAERSGRRGFATEVLLRELVAGL